MAHGQTDAELIERERNTARFFTENRQLAWVLLAGTLLWGAFGYLHMPKRKDPQVPVRLAVALCPWPLAGAAKIEESVTAKIEQTIAENPRVVKIDSNSLTSVSVVYLELDQQATAAEVAKQFDDIRLKLDSIHDLPPGAGPITFLKDFDPPALMLTVASPKADAVEIRLRAQAVRQAIEAVRPKSAGSDGHVSAIVCLPFSISPEIARRERDLFISYAQERGFGDNLRRLEGAGFVGVDGDLGADDRRIFRLTGDFFRERLRPSERHPDQWPVVLIRDPGSTEEKLAMAASDRYSYRDLDDFTDLIQRTLQTVPQVSKVDRWGVLNQKIYLEYSQERIAAYGLQPSALRELLNARNTAAPGGVVEADNKNIIIDPSGEFRSEKEIGDTLIGTSPRGAPVYLRDAVNVVRAYDNPPRYLNFYTWRDSRGAWRRTRAITLAIQMRSGEQIAEFGKAVDSALAGLRRRLPPDLILARTSDQPLQVQENVGLFMRSLCEAVVLVVLLALIGFWEWRAALLMALAIPLTLAMTFGMMQMLGIDVQQVSIASLIIALGLLIDDPVVAGDAIKRELASGHRPRVAAWLGPTKLATAILFATITNVVAYLPMLLLKGDVGQFIVSLPVVLACSLVSSRIVSMTFVPLLGSYLLRPGKRPAPRIEERRSRGLGRLYYRFGNFALNHRRAVIAISLLFLASGAYFRFQLKPQLFPKDLSYLSFVDVWLPADATFGLTRDTAGRVSDVILRTAERFGAAHPGPDGRPRRVLESLTAFVGGSGPRFWYSLRPEFQQLNYAQLVVQVTDKHDTAQLVPLLQRAVSAAVPGARVDVRQLETGKAVGLGVSIRISGADEGELRSLGEQAKAILRADPKAAGIRDDWGEKSFSVNLQINPDRANLAGISNMDVALSSVAGMSGYPVGMLREGKQQIPVVARLRTNERARLGDVENLYVYSTHGPQKAPLRQVSSVRYRMETERIVRRNQFRTLTVSCYPVPGALPSEIMDAARPALTRFAQSLPLGYKMEIGGEEEEQVRRFKELGVVMAISVVAIFLALVFQFRSAVKPLIVFAAIPYGVVGALGALAVMHQPFGFMAFLGVASLVGVIVSHVIVLFDFIEEAQANGEPLQTALLDAGVLRLRPVLITVGATVFALIPLALHGGPLWEPLCYAQIGGLIVATGVTLLLVPVLYATFVRDLKILKWIPPARTGMWKTLTAAFKAQAGRGA